MLRKLRSSQVVLSAAFTALVSGLTGCGEPEEPDNAQVCKEEISDMRVDDSRCEDNDSGTHWFYIPMVHGYPPVGEKINVNTGTYARPVAGTTSTVRPAGLGGSSYNSSSGS